MNLNGNRSQLRAERWTMLDVGNQAERQEELPALVTQVKSGFEAMVLALADYRERLKVLEAEIVNLRQHCEGHCRLRHNG
jgi:hypothetical protein